MTFNLKSGYYVWYLETLILWRSNDILQSKMHFRDLLTSSSHLRKKLSIKERNTEKQKKKYLKKYWPIWQSMLKLRKGHIRWFLTILEEDLLNKKLKKDQKKQYFRTLSGLITVLLLRIWWGWFLTSLRFDSVTFNLLIFSSWCRNQEHKFT